MEQYSTLHPGMLATPGNHNAHCGYIFNGIYSCMYITLDVFTGESSACTVFLQDSPCHGFNGSSLNGEYITTPWILGDSLGG